MKRLKYENLCYLCSIIYGIAGSLELILTFAIDSLLIKSVRTAAFGVILINIIINLTFIIRLDSMGSMIKVFFKELKITLFALTAAFLIWLTLFEIAAFFAHIYKDIFDKTEIKECILNVKNNFICRPANKSQ